MPKCYNHQISLKEPNGAETLRRISQQSVNCQVVFRRNRRSLRICNEIFEKQPFLMGAEFGVADAAVESMLNIPMMLKLDLSADPAVLEYRSRISERAAFQKAIDQG